MRLGEAKRFLALSFLALAAVPASAQTQDVSAAEIIVTAQKREQAIQDVGMSIVGLSGDAARERGIDTIEDLERAVPGLTFARTPAGPPVLTLRGVGFYDSTLSAAPRSAPISTRRRWPCPASSRSGSSTSSGSRC